MARTKQTAKKVTGGHAPRLNLFTLQKKKAQTKVASKRPVKKIKLQPGTNSAFYSKGEPVLPNPPHLKGVFEHATASQVGQAQVNMLNDFLQAYFPNKAYSFSKLPFNLATQDTQATYQKAATSLATSLSSYPRVVLFLTTHSDEDRGDLFAGYDEDNNPHASQVFQVLQLLLTPLAEIIEGADMVFYVCGSVVTEAQSFNGVKQAAKL
ncbi:hypothetical protein BKA82DRAFT_23311 [Pisolithus tinctorius]|nr:hypothetical protein BKA82DRAFT_23311 [Pisolithus tinctorius]